LLIVVLLFVGVFVVRGLEKRLREREKAPPVRARSPRPPARLPPFFRARARAPLSNPTP